MRIAYAGDRDISVRILEHLMEKGIKPQALLVSEKKIESHAVNLKRLCSHLDSKFIFEGNNFKRQENIDILRDWRHEDISFQFEAINNRRNYLFRS